jgi:hypothetical protein
MSKKVLPFNKMEIEKIIEKTPTPFHIYDEKAIIANARALKAAFVWNEGFREYFAVKATPNPYIMKILAAEGFGSDCSSGPELVLSESVGVVGEQVMFTSNDTPVEEFRRAKEMGAILNLDDISHIDFVDYISKIEVTEFEGRRINARLEVDTDVKSIGKDILEIVEQTNLQTFERFYKSAAFSLSEQFTSEILNEMGYVGIKYPSPKNIPVRINVTVQIKIPPILGVPISLFLCNFAMLGSSLKTGRCGIGASPRRYLVSIKLFAGYETARGLCIRSHLRITIFHGSL